MQADGKPPRAPPAGPSRSVMHATIRRTQAARHGLAAATVRAYIKGNELYTGVGGCCTSVVLKLSRAWTSGATSSARPGGCPRWAHRGKTTSGSPDRVSALLQHTVSGRGAGARAPLHEQDAQRQAHAKADGQPFVGRRAHLLLGAGHAQKVVVVPRRHEARQRVVRRKPCPGGGRRAPAVVGRARAGRQRWCTPPRAQQALAVQVSK